ncbi:hypothetical protein CR492_05160 [Methylocella silvestris]|uniref:Uncharacterized protein n=1 Tax=Methylocella silvestris TaxID=199596 RepID=A0A2J7TJY3_METSI|nr:hypothetical protein CR492_05160 [Methylocella silvestris]
MTIETPAKGLAEIPLKQGLCGYDAAILWRSPELYERYRSAHALDHEGFFESNPVQISLTRSILKNQSLMAARSFLRLSVTLAAIEPFPA